MPNREERRSGSQVTTEQQALRRHGALCIVSNLGAFSRSLRRVHPQNGHPPRLNSPNPKLYLSGKEIIIYTSFFFIFFNFIAFIFLNNC